MGTVIVVTSGKGGTGKTSFTGGVSSCLAALGKRVLCLDADVGLRNLDLSLGLTDRAVMDFSDVLAGRASLSEAAAEQPDIPGLFLLTAPLSLPETESDLSALLPEVRRSFDFCLIDCPAGIGSGFRRAAAGADRAVVVTTTDASSLRDAQRTVTELSAQGAEQIGQVHLVVNRVQKRLLRKLRRNLDDAMDEAGLPLLGVVPEDAAVMLAANRGVPLVLTGPGGAARAYLNIARRLLGERVPVMRIR